MADNRETGRINTSNFDGQALLLAGGENESWQGDIAAEEIGEELGANAEVVIYDEAGHLFGFGAPPYIGGLAMGGTQEESDEVKVNSDERLLQFLEGHTR